MKFNPEGGEFPVYDYGGMKMADMKAPPKPKPTPAEVLKEAPIVTEILARPFVYEVWLKKLQEALNG